MCKEQEKEKRFQGEKVSEKYLKFCSKSPKFDSKFSRVDLNKILLCRYIIYDRPPEKKKKKKKSKCPSKNGIR